MKAFLDCFPCAVGQALRAARIATDDEQVHRAAVVAALRELADVDSQATPMELGRIAQRIAKQVTGCRDPYAEIKKQSNSEALRLYPHLKQIVQVSDDPLRTATKIAIAGNIIDFGAPHKIDVEAALERVLASDFAVDDYGLFAQRLADAPRVLYLADNAGEIVFDRVLIEEIPAAEVTVAVKDQPFINDVLLADATVTGLTDVARVIEVPIYPDTSPQLEDAWAWADLIIAKGQANYEAYSDADGLIFFLLLAKCDCVARDVGVNLGDMILQARDNRNT